MLETFSSNFLFCRYTFFIVLYPFGITGELLCIYAAQAYVAEHKTFTLEMPNSLNATFSYQYFLIANMFGYIPGMVLSNLKIVQNTINNLQLSTEY